MIDKDLVIIGGGLGGYEAAIIASNKGLNVALIEKDEIGGTYLNHGYIPTKALYNSAFFSKNIKNCKELGFNIADFTIDFPTIQKQKQEIVNRLRSNIMMMLDKAKVEVIKGIASFKDENTIEVKCEENVLEISAEYFIIATGSEENIIPIEGYDLKRVLTSKELLNIEENPKSLVVIGGGVIGVELATIFNELGSKVVIYENFDRLIPFLDTDISSRLEVYLKKIGIEVITYALVEKITETTLGLNVSGKTKKDKTFTSDTEYVLLATGRKACYDSLNLDKINVVYDNRGIVVNENMQTSIEHIYAVGDVTGFHMLAHAATFQSIKALEHILGQENNTNFRVVPVCVLTFPEIVVVGLTEEEAKAKYADIKVHTSMFRNNGKSITMDEEDGFVKVIAAKGKIVGVHIIGKETSTLIPTATILIEREIPIKAITNIIHAHPTLSLAILDAVKGLE